MNQVCCYLIFCCISFCEVCRISVEHRYSCFACFITSTPLRSASLLLAWLQTGGRWTGLLHFKTDLGSGLWGLKGCVCLQGTIYSKPGNYSHRRVFSALMTGGNAVSLVFF